MPGLRLAVATIIVGLLAGCAGPGAPVATSAPPASASATTAPATLAPTPTPQPTPTADIAHPVGIIAIGHSGLTGEGTAQTSQANPLASWATGEAPDVNSIYLRLVAVQPETRGHVSNTAAGGAKTAMLPSQATTALAVVPAPALAIVQTVDNDLLCDGSNIAQIGVDVGKALVVIHDASPNTRILIVGQLGRPSLDFVNELVAAHPEAKAGLTWDDPCSFFDADGNIRKSGLKMLSDDIDAYEAETARVCAAVENCATDGGVRAAWIDKFEYFSRDFAHLNVKGQAAEAELIWPVIKTLLGL